MSQQSNTGFGVAHPIGYSPQNTEKKEEKKEEKFDEDISLEEALSTL
tara:strand:- start:2621 stop:2761 length:141 start_codon:yes stop_codon:yes gene_type:complete